MKTREEKLKSCNSVLIEVIKDSAFLFSESHRLANKSVQSLQSDDLDTLVGRKVIKLYVRVVTNIAVLCRRLHSTIKEYQAEETVPDFWRSINNFIDEDFPRAVEIISATNAETNSKVEIVEPEVEQQPTQEEELVKPSFSLSLKRVFGEVSEETSDGSWTNSIDKSTAAAKEPEETEGSVNALEREIEDVYDATTDCEDNVEVFQDTSTQNNSQQAISGNHSTQPDLTEELEDGELPDSDDTDIYPIEEIVNQNGIQLGTAGKSSRCDLSETLNQEKRNPEQADETTLSENPEKLISTENSDIYDRILVDEKKIEELDHNMLSDGLLALLTEIQVPAEESDDDDSLLEDLKSSKSSRKSDIFEDLLNISLSSESKASSGDITDWSDPENTFESVDLGPTTFESSPDSRESVIKTLDHNDNKELLKECYVELKDIGMNYDYKKELSNNSKTKKADNIDRLCDLSALDKKPVRDKRKTRKVYKKTSKSNLENSSNSDTTLSDTDCESCGIEGDLNFLKQYSEKEDPTSEVYANAIINNICEDTVDDSSVTSCDSNVPGEKKRKKTNIKKNHRKSGGPDKKGKYAEDDLERRAWKNDPLLRMPLSSSASDTDATCEVFLSDVTSSSSIDLLSNKKRESKTKTIKKKSNSLKKMFQYDISESDEESDGVIIVPIEEDLPKTNAVVISDEENPQREKRGRRNIRAVMSREDLAHSTQLAESEERERISRLAELQERLTEPSSQSSETLILDVNEPQVRVHPRLYKRLKPHQKEGVLFMWLSCYESVKRLTEHPGSGCILAHCMGLGKTFQVVTLIHTLFSHPQTNTKHVLIVCPVTTTSNWRNEFQIAFKVLEVRTSPFKVFKLFDKRTSSSRFNTINNWHRDGGVLILGYEMFETLTNEKKLEKLQTKHKEKLLKALIDPGPDLMVCDEGHLLRNQKALKTIALNRVATARRIALTGTPLQNNLKEYYQMVQFVKPHLLGTLPEFKTNFVNPITNGQYGDSTPFDIKLMKNRTHVLHKMLNQTIQRYEVRELEQYLPKLLDYAIFIKLHPCQSEMYKYFLNHINAVPDNMKKGFLMDYSYIMQICSHPHLFNIMENLNKIRSKPCTADGASSCILDTTWWKKMIPDDVDKRIEYGSKMSIMFSILEEAEELNDKILIFSQNLAEMDCIEHFLKTVGTRKHRNWVSKLDYYRMDGSVPPVVRSEICDMFNDPANSRFRVFLISYRVGGLGLNLTSANRVILMDVNFNPSYDTQSIYRVYRFGQTKPVVVYRLITMGTMEQKIYQRSVTKLAIASRVVDMHQITRHYKHIELKEMYRYDFDLDSERPVLDVPQDTIMSKLLLEQNNIYKYHQHQQLLENRPDECLNEQEKNAAWEEFLNSRNAIQAQAQAQMQAAAQANNLTTIDLSTLDLPSTSNGIALAPEVERFSSRSQRKVHHLLRIPDIHDINDISSNVINLTDDNDNREPPLYPDPKLTEIMEEMKKTFDNVENFKRNAVTPTQPLLTAVNLSHYENNGVSITKLNPQDEIITLD